MALIDRLADLLQFADGLVQKSHFSERDSQVVMSLGIFLSCCGIFFEFLLELAEHVRQVDASAGRRRRNSSSGQGPRL